jgi:hypothetical protein
VLFWSDTSAGSLGDVPFVVETLDGLAGESLGLLEMTFNCSPPFSIAEAIGNGGEADQVGAASGRDNAAISAGSD